MRIAVVGSGISGLASAWLLSRRHDVVLFEADARLGGHTHTHEVEIEGRMLSVDTGFIVHNRAHYPLLSRMFDALGVQSQPTTMGFSVRNERSGLEYNATSLDRLFCQRRNLASPRFLGMLRDLMRFYRVAPTLLAPNAPDPTLGEFLATHKFGVAFRDDHLVPMACALWSSPVSRILEFPARHLVRFMHQHQMLQLSDRPQWRVVRGGSSQYIRALQRDWRVDVRLRTPVHHVQRDAQGVVVYLDGGTERFDRIVLACHSDQALALLGDADEKEVSILGSIPYQSNETLLHTDASVLPRNPKAWAAWNAHVPSEDRNDCTVSYCMNLLQSLDVATPLIVSLNRTDAIDPAKVLARMSYAHPVFTRAAVAAQKQRAMIQGVRHTWFAGAYWGWGFHEDGMRSAVDVAEGLGVRWITQGAGAPTDEPVAESAWAPA